ncbi:DUF4401 domain-containing protein [Polaribacter sp.]|uniref:DUF4401 domain-containing protein n=1 Tax=Polaribacter sp. TaxID=1920175 RepID=UPI003EF1E52E
MDKLTSKKALLDTIRLSEGVNFECDENAVFKEYELLLENKSSLAIKILSIFGGLLAMLAFLGFLGIAGLYNSESGLLLFGIGFIVLAIWLNKVYDKLIIDTFSISIYIIGFAMLAIGLTGLKVEENSIILLISAIAICSLCITQNYLLSLISILTIFGCCLSLIVSNKLYNLVHLYIAFTTLIMCYLFLNEAKIIVTHQKLSKLYNPVRIGLILSLLFGLVAIGKKNVLPIQENYLWLSSIIMIMVILYLVSIIIKINQIKAIKSKILIYSLSFFILLSTVFSPAISGAILIMLLSFLVNYKTGVIIGIIAFIYFISQYYYDLNFTLLTKSILLFVSGVLFLLFYLFTTKNLHSDEKI